MKPALWAGAVLVEGGRILLVRRSAPPDAGTWSLPAVEVAAGEPLVAAVVRAVEEGTGLEAVGAGLLGYVEQLGSDAHQVLLAFSASTFGVGSPSGAAAWVLLDEVTEHPLAEGLAELLADQGILRLIV